MTNLHPIFQSIIQKHAPALMEQKFPIQYKGYTIEEDFDINPYNKDPQYMFYPTNKGPQHDADGDSDGYKYTGNCKWADCIDEAMNKIDELIKLKI